MKSYFSKLIKKKSAMIALFTLLAFSVYSAFYDLRLFFVGIALLILDLSSISVVIYLSEKRMGMTTENSDLMSNVTLDYITKSPLPVSILDKDGGVLWYNRAFAEKNGDVAAIYGRNIKELSGDSLSIREFSEYFGEKIPAKLGDTPYEVNYHRLNTTGGVFYIVTWVNMTEVRKLEADLLAKNPIVAHIVIDNAGENSSAMQDRYRTVSAQISIALREWAESIHALFSEYDRDKFIVILNESELSPLCEKKFEILDSVRALSNEMTVPLTISIGITAADGTLAEKDAFSRQALDLALQRGGDQAVVKTRESIEFYGGKTKTVQKRTKIRSRVIAAELTGLMKNASNVIIMGHKRADFDSIGACIGMARMAMRVCGKVNIVVNIHDENMKKAFLKLRGLPEYKNIFVDSVMGQELVEADTLLVIVDVNNYSQFEAVDIYENVCTSVIIDHHRKTGELPIAPVISYIEPSASSASELVSEMLEQSIDPGNLLKEEADLLLAGIMLDTKNFSRSTGVRTFAAAQYLRGEGAGTGDVAALFTYTLDEVKKEAEFETKVIIYKETVAISVHEGEVSDGIKIAAPKAAEKLLSVNGVLAAFVLYTIDDTIYISARSSGVINVQLILETFNGGGHFDSAGAQIKGVPMKKVLATLKESIDSRLESK